MARFNSPLANVRIASPCSSDWSQMRGDERVRFCQQCSLNVYNLSSMTRREAEHLIANMEGRLCVRYYRRRDGTILTGNCPVGLRAVKRRMTRAASATLSAVLGFFAGLGIYTGTAEKEPELNLTTMGQIAVPEESPVNSAGVKYIEVVGTFAYERGKMEPQSYKTGRTVRRTAKKAQR